MEKLTTSLAADISILSQIMAAQNLVFLLPARKNLGEFFADSLSMIPGTGACKVCFGHPSNQQGKLAMENCRKCNEFMSTNENSAISKDLKCVYKNLPGYAVFNLETMDLRFGFFVFSVTNKEVFEVYRPYISNLANFVGLTLENRVHKLNLQEAKDSLEQKVAERTNSLQITNQKLEKEISERVKTEKELQDQNSTLSGIINSANAIIFSVNRNYEYTNFNMRHALVMKTIYGFDIEAGKNMLEYMTDWSDRDKAKANLDRALAGEYFIEESLSGDISLARQYFEVHHSPIKSDNGEVIGVSVLVQDITERKKNEAVNTSRLHLIHFSMNHSLDELLEETLNETEKLTDSQIGFYHFVNDDQKSLALQAWSARTKAEFCKAAGKGLHYDIDNAGVWVDCVYEKKTVIHNDYESLPHKKGMPEGHARVVRELVVPVYRGDKVAAILGVGNKLTDYTAKDAEMVSLIADLAWEIAEKKKAEEALFESQQVFRNLVENSPDIIARYDRNLKRNYINPVYLNESKIPIDKLIATSPKELSPLPPASADKLQRLLQKVFETGNTSTEDVEWPKQDNIAHWYNIQAAPEFDRDGNVQFVMTVSREITERKLKEENIRKLNQELETRVASRTAQLEAVNKELEAFAYSVSHDLRAPLRHIDGFMEMLRDHTGQSLDEESLLLMNDISGAVNRMGNLIDDLLSFSRMGRMEMMTQCVELDTLVKEVIREFSPDIANRRITWNVHDMTTISGDRSLLRLVLVNLISNAIKFTRVRDEAIIEIACEDKELETILFVRDNGVGFDMQYDKKLFGVFQRLHRNDEFEGTGIGLANVRRIIERHGGKTWATGQIDAGATFFLSLPKNKT